MHDQFGDEGVAWPSFVDFLTTFIFVLFLFTGSLLYLETGDIERRQIRRRVGPQIETLNERGFASFLSGTMAVISLKGKVEFDRGQSELQPRHRRQLREVARYFPKLAGSRRIIVAGYADRTPYKGDPFGNWSLSVARARGVLEFFYNCRDCGYGPEVKRKLSLAGEGDIHALRLPQSGDRRVDIIIDFSK